MHKKKLWEAVKSCKEAGNKLLQSFSQAGKSTAASWKKFVQSCALRKYNFVQYVEKVCANVQKMKKLTKCKAVRVCENARNICIKVQKIVGN